MQLEPAGHSGVLECTLRTFRVRCVGFGFWASANRGTCAPRPAVSAVTGQVGCVRMPHSGTRKPDCKKCDTAYTAYETATATPAPTPAPTACPAGMQAKIDTL